MLHPLYTVGYTGIEAGIFANAMFNFFESQGGKLIDVRYKPFSKNQSYQWFTLATLFGDNYRRAGDKFGNINYNQPEKGVQLADPDAYPLLVDMLKEAPQVIMCGCKGHETCHRTHVARLIEDAYPDKALIIHLTITDIVRWSDRTQPALQPVPPAPVAPTAVQKTLF